MEEEKVNKNSPEFQLVQKEIREKKILDKIEKAVKDVEFEALPKAKRRYLEQLEEQKKKEQERTESDRKRKRQTSSRRLQSLSPERI